MNEYVETKRRLLHTYARDGWRLLPTWWVTESTATAPRCACQLGIECRKPGKHPRISNWETRATTDVGDLDGWHDAWPLANWGWVQDQTFAIDVDRGRGGLDSLHEWIEMTGGPPATLTQETASGGLHFIYRQPDDAPVPQVADFMPGIEVRGVGSYIMVEPSVGMAGSWSFQDHRVTEIVECDDDTLALIRSRQTGSVTVGADGRRRADRSRTSDLPPTHEFIKRGFGFHTGSRNVDAYRLTWRLLAERERDTWTTLDNVKRVMHDIWKVTPQGEHPFTWEEVVGVINSAKSRRERQSAESEYELTSTQAAWAQSVVRTEVKDEDMVTQPVPNDDNEPHPGPTQGELDAVARLALNTEAHRLPRTDDGSAQRVVVYFGDRLRYVKALKEWRLWDGRRWALAQPADTVWVARQVSRQVGSEVALFEDDTERQSHAGYARLCSSLARMEAMMRVATGDERLWAAGDDFDRDPLLLHFLNGTLDVRTGELRPHDPADLNTHLIPRRYDPDAPAPRWESFVRRVVAEADRLGEKDDAGNDVGCEDAYRFTQTALGYSLLGANPEHQIFFFQGAERCGKSQLLEVVTDVVGEDYAHPARSDLVAKMRTGHHASETFSLIGRHLVTISETPTTFQLDENRVKSLTGDAKQPVYQLYSGVERAARTTWTICLATNHLPNVQNWDGAVRERIVIIPCGPTVPPEERDQRLAETLRAAETEGILAWLVAGARRWYEASAAAGGGDGRMGSGLARPLCVELAMSEFEQESDHLGAFIEDVVEVTGNPKDRVARTAVLERAKRWRSRGESVVIDRNRLYARVKGLRGVGLTPRREFTGVRLRPEGDLTDEQRAWADRMREQ